jgi:hypothetical protein
MTGSVFALVSAFATVRLHAQTDHPDHNTPDRSSREAQSHDTPSHNDSGRNTPDHDRAQATVDRNMQNAKEVTEAQQKERDREQMRDKDHDGRLKVSDHTSVGGRIEPGGGSVNVKTDIDRPGPTDHPK